MIQFDHDHLAALRLALDTVATVTEARTTLQGVHFDFPQGRLIATDGVRLFAAALPPEDTDAPALPARTFMVKNAATGAQVRKIPNGWRTAYLDLEALVLRSDPDGRGGEFRLEEITETFPDTDRVVLPFLGAAGGSGLEVPRLVLNPDLLKGWNCGKQAALSLEFLAKPYPALLVTFPFLALDHLALVAGMAYSPSDPRTIAGGLFPSHPAPEA